MFVLLCFYVKFLVGRLSHDSRVGKILSVILIILQLFISRKYLNCLKKKKTGLR